MFIKAIQKLCNVLMRFPRKKYYEKMTKKLKNSGFSIISSNCFGGFVYHNLNQRFHSPTINLFFSVDDFLCFVTNLREYLSVDLIEVCDHDRNYPVGQLTYEGKTIRIEFMHYHSFEEAKSKWDERKLRVDYSNLYIVLLVEEGVDSELVTTFQNLPYENKLLITKENDYKCDCMVTHPIFSSKRYRIGQFLKYKSLLSCKRYMDEIDYVGFLNGEYRKD